MNKERLIAFTDAILAIIMTILVLELAKPPLTLHPDSGLFAPPIFPTPCRSSGWARSGWG